MGRPQRLSYPGATFHIIARGNHRERIFFEKDDWIRFLEILSAIKTARPFKLYAYCLMANHFHLLVETNTSSISEIMGLILVRYAKYLNARLERTGHVFQDRFKSIPCPRDDYFRHLIRYIHLNPVRAGIVNEPLAWPYSGHHDYIGTPSRKLVDTNLPLGTFHRDEEAAKAAYIQFMIEGIANPGDCVFPIPDKVHMDRSEGTIIQGYAPLSSPNRPSLEELGKRIATEAGFSMDQLGNPIKVPEVVCARRKFIFEAFRAGHPPVRIAAHLQMSRAAISKALSRES